MIGKSFGVILSSSENAMGADNQQERPRQEARSKKSTAVKACDLIDQKVLSKVSFLALRFFLWNPQRLYAKHSSFDREELKIQSELHGDM